MKFHLYFLNTPRTFYKLPRLLCLKYTLVQTLDTTPNQYQSTKISNNFLQTTSKAITTQNAFHGNSLIYDHHAEILSLKNILPVKVVIIPEDTFIFFCLINFRGV